MNRKRRRIIKQEQKQNLTFLCLQQLKIDLLFKNENVELQTCSYESSMEEGNSSLLQKLQKIMNQQIILATKQINFQLNYSDHSIRQKLFQNGNNTNQQSLPLKKKQFQQFQLDVFSSKSTISTPDMTKQFFIQSQNRETVSNIEIDSDDLPSQINIENKDQQPHKQLQYYYYDYLADKADSNYTIELKKPYFIPYKRKNIESQYKLLEKIGEGSFGQVFKCQNVETKVIRAVKIVKHQKLNLKYNRQILKRQIQILKLLDHPHVIKMYEIFESDQIIYFVCEYCDGGTLKTYLKNKPLLTPAIIKKILFQILQTVNYMHQKNIIHRDLKPQNILFVNKIYKDCPDDIIDIRIIDFGLSIQYKGNMFKDWAKLGSLPYMAPQVFKGIYSNKCDIWSCGVIAHTLFLKHNPFHQQDTNLIQQKTRAYQLKQNQNWNTLSKEQQQVLQKLLQKNYVMRPEISNVLKLKYFSFIKLQNVVSESDKHFIYQKILSLEPNKTIIDYFTYFLIINTFSQQQISQYRNIFNLIDKDYNGVIDEEEIKLCLFDKSQATQSVDINEIQVYLMDQQQRYQDVIAHNVHSNLNLDKTGMINFTQFLFAFTNKKQLFTIENILFLFNQIDSSKDGYIDLFELTHFLIAAKKNKEHIVQNFLKSLTGNKNGKATSSQFLWYFLNHFYFDSFSQ